MFVRRIADKQRLLLLISCTLCCPGWRSTDRIQSVLYRLFAPKESVKLNLLCLPPPLWLIVLLSCVPGCLPGVTAACPMGKGCVFFHKTYRVCRIAAAGELHWQVALNAYTAAVRTQVEKLIY